MKTRLLIMLAAMLLSASAFAQSDGTPLKGDLDGDGKVDVADINEIIKIMKDAGGTAEPNTYYWYVGQTDPSTMTSISPIVTDNSSPGWRKIGTTIGTYTLSNPLWDGALNKITVGATKADTYVVLPNNSLKVRDGDGNVADGFVSQGTKQINGVSYSIYKVPNLKIFNGIIF